MVCILTEPNYADSVWCKNFLNSLIESLRKNRIPFCEVFDEIPKDAETVFIIAADSQWIKSTVQTLNEAQISPILICNHIEPMNDCRYSCVSSDIQASIHAMLRQISAGSNRTIALYGINAHSVSDIGKVDTVFSHKDALSVEFKLFNNDGSLAECFDRFLPHIHTIDTVICTNGFSAISLIKHLEETAPEKLEALKIFSLTDSALSAYYSHYITSVNIDYTQYGKAAVHICKSIKKHTYISTMNIAVPWTVSDADTHHRVAVPVPLPTTENSIYADTEFADMMKVEKLLSSGDATDKTILAGLTGGLSAEQICHDCFVTESAVKYRIKKMLTYGDFKDKGELVHLVKKYTRHP